MNVGIYIYDNAEVLDFSGPFEVFSTANRLSPGGDAFNVFLLGERKAPIKARASYSVNPHYDIDDHPALDVLLVPGGVHEEELGKEKVIRWVSRTAESAAIVASVCTGAFILAEAGLLSNLTATTHWEDIDDFRNAHPQVTVIDSQRWVDEGKMVTSAGISAGIDMSLHLVSRLAGHELALATARQMDYRWEGHS